MSEDHVNEPPVSEHHVKDQQLQGARYEHVDLSGAVFDEVDLTGARMTMVDFADVTMRDVALRRVKIDGAELEHVHITGDIVDVTVNGVDIGPLVEAELDRLHPERPLLRPHDADGYREAWRILTELWKGTVERAQRLDPAQLHTSVDGEWSFTQTLRHLAFASNSWVGRAVLGNPSPWHPLDLPWGEMPDTVGVPHDREAQPTLSEALAIRGAAQDLVAGYLAAMTDEQLASTSPPVHGPGWPAPDEWAVKKCLDIVINEEWWHRQFAERDLALLESHNH